MSTPPFGAIGSAQWPGLAKLVEEAGEVVQIAGKLIATGGDAVHWDGSNLVARLEEELGDLRAAIRFVEAANPRLSRDRIGARYEKKVLQFADWHDEATKKTP